MIRFTTKLFRSKFLLGMSMVIIGASFLVSNEKVKDNLLGINILLVLVMIAFGYVFRKKKVEPEDELAILNQKKAREEVFTIGMLVLFFIILWKGSITVTINIGLLMIVTGIFSILEYMYFLYLEKKDTSSYE